MTEVTKSASLRRKTVIVLWILTVVTLLVLLALTLLSHFYMPAFFETFYIIDMIAMPVAFVLLLVMFALNSWRPLRENPYK